MDFERICLLEHLPSFMGSTCKNSNSQNYELEFKVFDDIFEEVRRHFHEQPVEMREVHPSFVLAGSVVENLPCE